MNELIVTNSPIVILPSTAKCPQIKILILIQIKGAILVNGEFNKLLKSNPHQQVSIHFNSEKPDEWIIVPIVNNDEMHRLSIRFTLPELLLQYIHQDAEKAMIVKEKMIGKIAFIAYLDNINPTFCTLSFDKAATLNNPWAFR